MYDRVCARNEPAIGPITWPSISDAHHKPAKNPIDFSGDSDEMYVLVVGPNATPSIPEANSRTMNRGINSWTVKRTNRTVMLNAETSIRYRRSLVSLRFPQTHSIENIPNAQVEASAPHSTGPIPSDFT